MAQNESPPPSFLELSELLTGFNRLDLLGTGLAQSYYDDLLRSAGEKNVNALLAATKKVGKSTSAFEKAIWDDERFGPVGRNIVLMWYLGSSYPLPESWREEYGPDSVAIPEHVVSAAAYQEGLVWSAMGTHARGAKPPGFGSWGVKPGNSDPHGGPQQPSKTEAGQTNSAETQNHQAEDQQKKQVRNSASGS